MISKGEEELGLAMGVSGKVKLAGLPPRQSYRFERLNAFVYRTAVLALLLITVPALAVRVKSSLGSPSSDPGRRLSIASKMKVTHPPIVADWREPLPRFSESVPVPEGPVVRLLTEPEVPVRKVSLTICLQHRSPPSRLI